ncbi:MAG: hypothetical protein KFF77_05780, partial [Bacteroidetes bacterium]|nr:hypothetical protein [Bacteroidota bacterium]
YCRAQYDALLEMEELEEADADAPHGAPGVPAFRLAAQSGIEMDTRLTLRQTWYLDHGNVLLRVFEEDAERLVAYVLCAPERLSRLRFHFSDIPGVFAPDADGHFAIGPAGLPIEPMTVTFEEPT